MLLELHVRNLALIEKADVELGEGLNILTGETGAGKSIIIGSVNMALGGKTSRDSIRRGADYGYVELLFQVEEEKREILGKLDVFPAEDGTLIISRKIMPSRSVSKINDETVTTAKLKQITSLLLDIHGQHEHQSLLYQSKHLEILDEYIKEKIQPLKQNISEEYRRYCDLKSRLEGFSLDEEGRRRESDFYRFEIEEIENAALKEGEEEELSALLKKLNHSRRIMESLSEAYDAVSIEGMGRALKSVDEAAGYDEGLKNIRDQLYDIDALLSDVSHEISSYLGNLEMDEGLLAETEERLDVIRSLQAKYGKTVKDVLESLEEKKKKLEELEDYDALRQKTEKELEESRNCLEESCRKLSEIRQEASISLTEKIKNGLNDLNFIDVSFSMVFTRMERFTANGFDTAEFMISTNPGEPVKPLGAVASGGELSRIMLAIKTVLADSDDIPTLIFDEIDTGISGRTAQKVSEKLAYIAKSHQVICITHLPQIASMANHHYEIKKEVSEGRTITTIHSLNEEEMVSELARLLGGAQITEAVLENAREMKRMAAECL